MPKTVNMYVIVGLKKTIKKLKLNLRSHTNYANSLQRENTKLKKLLYQTKDKVSEPVKKKSKYDQYLEMFNLARPTFGSYATTSQASTTTGNLRTVTGWRIPVVEPTAQVESDEPF